MAGEREAIDEVNRLLREGPSEDAVERVEAFLRAGNDFAETYRSSINDGFMRMVRAINEMDPAPVSRQTETTEG